MNFVNVILKPFLKDQRGVSAIEYAVLAAIIVGLLVTAFTGDEGLTAIVETTFDSIKEKITSLTTET